MNVLVSLELLAKLWPAPALLVCLCGFSSFASALALAAFHKLRAATGWTRESWKNTIVI